MTLQAHLSELISKHKALETELADAITHPASTTHRNIGAEARAMMGITDGMLRLSVGLEDMGDLVGDLKQALAA